MLILPGCIGQGETEEAALLNLRAAIATWLNGMPAVQRALMSRRLKAEFSAPMIEAQSEGEVNFGGAEPVDSAFWISR